LRAERKRRHSGRHHHARYSLHVLSLFLGPSVLSLDIMMPVLRTS
jgi:hypothetical protein